MTTKLWSSVKHPQSNSEFLYHDFEIGGKEFTANIDHNPARGLSSMLFSRRSGKGNAYSLKGDMGVADARSVMMKMVPLVHEHLHGHKPNVLKFSADGAEPSRVKMYDWLAKRVHRIHPDYVALHSDDMEEGDTHVQRDYYLVHKDHVKQMQADKVKQGWPEPQQLAREDDSEFLTLHHFSSELPWENAVVDPDKFSTNRNKYTKAEHRESAFPRSFFYVDPKEKEGVVFGEHFTAKVPAKSVYDLRTDPEGHLPKAHSISHLLHTLEEAGYHGARYNNGRDIVTMWKPVPVERVPPTAPEQLSRDPKWSKMTGVQGEGRRSNFTVGNGRKYSAFMHQKAPGDYGFQFGLQEGENQQGITGTGHAKEVFGHVIGLLHQHLHDTEPKAVSFSADSSEPSRVKLYNYLISRVGRLHPDYEGVREAQPGSNLIKYSIKRKENPVQLAASKRNFLHDLAEGYHEKHKDRFGLDIHPTDGKFVFDPDLGKRTAAVFDKLKHQPDHPFVKKAYNQLKVELLAQHHHLTKAGIKFEPWEQAGQPYKDSKDMQADVLANKRIKYFKTTAGFGSDARFNDHPLMEDVPHMPGVKFNDLLRGVHDVLAHAKDGHQFGPKGEFQAWGEHARLFSPLARAALTTDTHGQNSWVNFGPHSHLPVAERPFGDQKAAVLPKSVTPKLQLSREWEEHDEGDENSGVTHKASFKVGDGNHEAQAGTDDDGVHFFGVHPTPKEFDPEFLKESARLLLKHLDTHDPARVNLYGMGPHAIPLGEIVNRLRPHVYHTRVSDNHRVPTEVSVQWHDLEDDHGTRSIARSPKPPIEEKDGPVAQALHALAQGGIIAPAVDRMEEDGLTDHPLYPVLKRIHEGKGLSKESTNWRLPNGLTRALVHPHGQASMTLDKFKFNGKKLPGVRLHPGGPGHDISHLIPLRKHEFSKLSDYLHGVEQDPHGTDEPQPEQLSRPVESDLSQQGMARKKLLLKLLLEAKLKPVAFGGSYALHASGMDAGSYAEIAHNNEPDAVNYVGHYYGLLNGQGSPDLHVFHQNDTGNHSLTVFDSPLPTDKLYEALAPALSSPMVRVIPKDGFNRVAVVNLQNSGILKDANAANTQQFRGDFSTLRGRGGESSSSREGHRNAIQAYERQYADAGT